MTSNLTGPASSPCPAPAPPTVHLLRLEVRRARDEALLHHPLDDLLDQILELLPRALLVAVGRFPEQLLQRFVREHASAEEGFENRRRAAPASCDPRRSHGRIAPGVAESARQQQVRELRDKVLEIDLVEQFAGVLGVAVFHLTSSTRVCSCGPTALSVVVLLLRSAARRDRRLVLGCRFRWTAGAPWVRSRDSRARRCG